VIDSALEEEATLQRLSHGVSVASAKIERLS
jgi:hypothetical protein